MYIFEDFVLVCIVECTSPPAPPDPPPTPPDSFFLEYLCDDPHRRIYDMLHGLKQTCS